MSNFGWLLCSFRRRNSLRRSDLGAMVGKSANTIGRWERGDTSPTIEEFLSLSNALEVPAAEFFTGRLP